MESVIAWAIYDESELIIFTIANSTLSPFSEVT